MKKVLIVIAITLAIPAGMLVMVLLWAIGMAVTGHEPPKHAETAGASSTREVPLGKKVEAPLPQKAEATPVDGPAKDDPSTYMMYSKGFIIGMGGVAERHVVLDHCEKDEDTISCKAHTVEEDLKPVGLSKHKCTGFDGYKFSVKAYHYGNDTKNATALPGAFASVPDVGCHENFAFSVHLPASTDVVTVYYYD